MGLFAAASIAATLALTTAPNFCHPGSVLECRAEDGAVCNWNGANFQPYSTTTGGPIGAAGTGYTAFADCETATRANVDGAVCNWNGSNFQPYSIATGRSIGPAGQGYLNFQDCLAATNQTL